MDDPWNNSDGFIEDRGHRSNYILREEYSCWASTLPRPTFVFGIHATLDGAVPPFKKFSCIENYPGDNLGLRNAGQNMGRDTPDRMSGSGYTTRSDDSRDDALRHRTLSLRKHFSNELFWQDARFDNRPCYGTRRQDQCNHATGGDRLRNHNIAFTEDTRTHVRAIGRANSRGTTPPPFIPAPPAWDRMVSEQPRILACPNLRLAPRGPDSHPQSPWALRRTSPDSIDDDDNGPHDDPDFVANEEDGIVRFNAKPLKDARSQPFWNDGNPHLLGRFHHCQIQTLEQAYNLISFLHIGQGEAYERFQVINQNGSGFPEVFRSEGEAYLIRHQQELERMWWNTTTGMSQPPRHVRHPNPRPPHHRACNAKNRGPQRNTAIPVLLFVPAPTNYTFGTTAPIRPTPATTVVAWPAPSTQVGPVLPAPPPPPCHNTDEASGYLGTSPPDPADVPPMVPSVWEFPALESVPNSRWSANELTNRFTRIHPRHWNMVVHDYLGHAPTTMGDTPNRNDVLVIYTIFAMAPADRRLLPHQFRLFFDAVMWLFSIKDLYDHVIRIGEYELDSLPLEHYPFLTDNITIYIVAAWFAQHGIAPGTPEVAAIEEFAQIRRNVSHQIPDWDNVEWAAEPRNATTSLSMTLGEIPHQRDIHHAPLCPVPPGISASIHAPMDGVMPTGDALVVAATALLNAQPTETTTTEDIVEGFVKVPTP
ncbi:hypothetical protein B0H11DRAFT_2262835 [Mycena galericulata]|nr:hypothetical protein B0H11DRAFT_2262835 [Mycena galericulata]